MKLLRYQIFVIVAFLCMSTASNAQDVDKIIDKHIAAHGDIQKWESIKSMEITGRFTAFSEEEDFYTIKTSKGCYYSELHLDQFKVIEAFNGSTGWTIDPWQEILYPRELNKVEVNVFYQKAEFFTPFYKYKERGFKVELMENQNVDGMEMIVIKLTRPNEKVETWFLNAKTYLEYKCESEWVDFAYRASAESYFDDFRTVDGIVIPYFIERTFYQRDRITQIENIVFNKEVDKSLFEMPQSEEINKLAFMEGEWDVKVEMMTRRGTWYNIDNTVSSISWQATNMLQEKIKYDMTFVQSKIINYTFNSDVEQYQLSVFNGFSSDIQIFEGNFVDTTFTLESAIISNGDTTRVKNYFQIVFSNMEEDSFILVIKASKDEGETWSPRQKFTYTRKKE